MKPAGWNGALSEAQFPIKAKRVIFLCMAGGPSHLETLDWKPELKALDGQPFPESFTKGQQLAQLQNTVLKARGPITGFQKHGQSGIEISDHFPHLAKVADDLCVIRSMQTEQINHGTAHAFMNTGSIIKGRPSMGSWLLYGLGAETQNLPGFVVRMIQLYHRAWDHHGDLVGGMKHGAKDVDQATAALISLNPEIGTTDFTDDTDFKALGAKILLTHWVRWREAGRHSEISESVSSVSSVVPPSSLPSPFRGSR